MITYDEILNMNYYQKTSYTGWTGGMRFLIRKEEKDDGSVFGVYAWPGPYNFEKTDDDKKLNTNFPFTEEGRKSCVDWLNKQLEEQEWPARKMAGY